MLSDIRYAIRGLRHNPGFTAAALIALALGIGANSAMFSVVYAVLLKPLPYRQPDRLVWIATYNKRFKAEIVAAPDFLDWRSQARSFDTVAAVAATDRTVTGVPEPFDIRTTAISEPLRRVFGVQPIVGRDFLPEELRPDAQSRPAIVSYRFFQSFFRGDRRALGASLALGDESFTVIGVLPPEFRLSLPSPFGPQTETAALLPLIIDPAVQRRDARAFMIVQVMGRLRQGVRLDSARAEMAAIEARLPRPPFIRPDEQTLTVELLRDRLLGNSSQALLILLGAVGFVLLIACANVANLLLARSAARRRETAVRLALGATRGRLLRQALVESVVIALVGGAAGLVLAAACLRFIVNWNAVVVPRLQDAALSPAVLLFALLISTATGVLFGIAPAISAARVNLNADLKPPRQRLRGLLVIAEVALSLVLAVGAGLMVKSLWVMHASAAAAAPERVLTSDLQISNPRFRDPAQSRTFVADFVGRIGSLPGVRAAAGVSGGQFGMLRPEGSTLDPIQTAYLKVTPGFFTAAGARLLKGRLLTEADGPDAPRVALINDALARRFGSPIGRQVRVQGPGPESPVPIYATIVGIVSDFRGSRLDAPVEPQLFLPMAQMRFGAVELMVRAISDPAALTGAIRSEGHTLGIALLHPETLAAHLDASIAPRRFEMTLLIAFAALALLLALIGIYGVMAYMVTQRTREIGIRVAVGAQCADVVQMMLASGLKLVVVGVLLGLAASLALTRVIESLLYGVKPTDFLTFAASSCLLIAVAACAAWVPARRAAAVDPTVALRYE